MTFTIDRFTQVYEAPATVDGTGGGFTPKLEGIGGPIVKGVEDTLANSNTPTIKGIRERLEIEHIISPENLIVFLKELEGKKLDLKYYNIILDQIKVYIPNISLMSFVSTMEMIFENDLINNCAMVHFDEFKGFDSEIHIFDNDGIKLLNKPKLK